MYYDFVCFFSDLKTLFDKILKFWYGRQTEMLQKRPVYRWKKWHYIQQTWLRVRQPLHRKCTRILLHRFGNKRRLLNIHSCWSQLKKKRGTKPGRLSYRRFEWNRTYVTLGEKKGIYLQRKHKGNHMETMYAFYMYTHLYFIILNHYVSMWMELITFTHFCRNYSYYHAYTTNWHAFEMNVLPKLSSFNRVSFSI